MKIKRSFEKQSFMIECLVDISPEYQNDRFKSIYYRKTNTDWVWFNLWVDQDGKKRYLGCSYSKIWSVFEDKFGMNDIDIQSFIKSMVLRHTNWGVVTPCFFFAVNKFFGVKTHKLGGSNTQNRFL